MKKKIMVMIVLGMVVFCGSAFPGEKEDIEEYNILKGEYLYKLQYLIWVIEKFSQEDLRQIRRGKEEFFYRVRDGVKKVDSILRKKWSPDWMPELREAHKELLLAMDELLKIYLEFKLNKEAGRTLAFLPVFVARG